MTTATTPIRTERRVKKERPGYLTPEVMERAATNAEARLAARLRARQAG